MSKHEYNQEEAINSIIVWSMAKAAGVGFAAGFASPVVSIPVRLAASYALGANTAAAIASVRGYNVESDLVRTLVFLALLGEESALEIMKREIANRGMKIVKNQFFAKGKVLQEINKQVGFRLITKAGTTGVINLMSFIPIVGNVIEANIDSAFANGCGSAAKKLFT